MKRVIVIVLVMLLIGGGSAGGLMMMGIIPNPFNPEIPAVALTDAEKAAQELSKKKFQGPTKALDLVKVDDMIVPVIIDGRMNRRVFITARLSVDTPANQTIVEANLRKYQDALMRDLVPFFQTYYVDHTDLDARVVKEKLMANAKKVYGDMVLDVLLINVFDQALDR